MLNKTVNILWVVKEIIPIMSVKTNLISLVAVQHLNHQENAVMQM